MAECGTRSKYVRGCRCEPCTVANRYYARNLDRHHRRVTHGIEEPVVRFVDATEAREHLLWLRSFGVGKRTVNKLTGIGVTTLWEITKGETLKVHPDTETKILDLWRDTRNNAMIVDASQTWKRITWLQQQGWSKARIARELGCSRPALQLRKDRVTYATEQRIEHLVRRVLTSD
jgi:hypothetical protein